MKKLAVLGMLCIVTVLLCSCACKHEEKVLPAEAPTCTVAGKTEGSVCTKCT